MPEREEIRLAPRTHSTAAVGQHPLHPAVVDFPIAFLSSALVSDLLFWWTRSPHWAEFSFWLILGGLLIGLLAFILGLIDFLTIERARQTPTGWLHFLVTDLALFLSLFNLVARLEDRQSSILFAGMGYSLVVTLLLLIGGYSGGRLVFRYLIGVYSQGDERKGEA